MFTFAWPWLALLLPLPVVVWWLFKKDPSHSIDVASPEILFPNLRDAQRAFSGSAASGGGSKRHWPWLLALTWMFFVFTLMRPQLLDQRAEAKVEGRDLMLAVDLSGSMRSLDFASEEAKRDRLDVAKAVVKDFVNKRAGDRVGLIVFGEHAYMQAPLTLDLQSVTHMLDNTLPGMAGDATAIGDALGLAVKNLRERPASSRAIVLLTDGEDNASSLPPLQAAKLAKQYGIKIYTIVIGKDGLVPYPDGHGGYVTVESHTDTTLTRQISEITGGEFFRATEPGMLAKIYDHIDALQRSAAPRPQVLIRHSLFEYPLALALLLVAVFACATIFRGENYELV